LLTGQGCRRGRVAGGAGLPAGLGCRRGRVAGGAGQGCRLGRVGIAEADYAQLHSTRAPADSV